MAVSLWTKMLSTVSRELICILSLSVCFMLLFAADNTMLNMQKIVVSSISDDRPDFKVEGYTMTGLTYSLFAISLWFGPYVNYAVGPRLTMVLSAVGYLISVVTYAVEEEWVIYCGAVIGGIAAGTLWPAQAHYLIQNSSPQTTARNVGIFWLIFTSSNMLGNLFVFFEFQGKKYIDQHTRRSAIYILSALNTIAIFGFMVLPKLASSNNKREYGPIKTIKKSWSVLTTRKMLWLSLTFSYAGLQQSFATGIYSPSIGFTLGFGDSVKELVALSGIFMSVGALIGSAFPIIVSGWILSQSWARKLVVLAGVLAQLCSYLIVFLNLPDSAVFGNTEELGIIQPSAVLAMLGSVLLCFGDSCLSTQMYSIIADSYRDCGAEAIALYKFVKAVFVAVNFYWCSHLSLHIQLTILAVTAMVGVTAFCVADQEHDSPSSEKQELAKVIKNDYTKSTS